MTYEEFKQLAEHPQHRDVPAIFKLEVLETEELEEKKRSHYPKYKVNTYCPQAFTTTLEEAERLMHQDVLYRKKMKGPAGKRGHPAAAAGRRAACRPRAGSPISSRGWNPRGRL